MSIVFVAFFWKWPWCLVLHSTFDFMIIPYVSNAICIRIDMRAKSRTNKNDTRQNHDIPNDILYFLTPVWFSHFPFALYCLTRFYIVRNERNDYNRTTNDIIIVILKEVTLKLIEDSQFLFFSFYFHHFFPHFHFPYWVLLCFIFYYVFSSFWIHKEPHKQNRSRTRKKAGK